MVADDTEELVADEPEVPVLELVTQESPREEAGVATRGSHPPVETCAEALPPLREGFEEPAVRREMKREF